ncbi:MAG: TIGR02996 domain-containing protein [Planctomycetia bacterium]|nr:TIGR02996 domain-containing protein [Planctomycetia bacterium]
MARSRTPKVDAPYPPGWEPFLAAINANLDDDTPRLVFADWLQENGDEERAEFIRIQCEGHRTQPSSPTDVCGSDLLRANRRRWLRGLPRYLVDNPKRWEFSRGFVTLVSVKGPKWSADGHLIRRLTALEHLILDRVYPDVMNSPALEGLRGLTLNGMTSETVATLTNSAIVPSLVDLLLFPISAAAIGDRYLSDLFAHPALTRLRRLTLDRTHRGNAVVMALADVPRLATLEEFHIQSSGLDASGAEALARFPGRLRVLSLPANPLGDEGVRQFVRSPFLRGLVELGLGSCELTNESARLLAGWDGLQSVKALNIFGNDIDRRSANLIANSPNARNLTDFRR